MHSCQTRYFTRWWRWPSWILHKQDIKIENDVRNLKNGSTHLFLKNSQSINQSNETI